MVRIITDSAADFTPAELERMKITCIPLMVMFGETEYEDGIALSKERFYELLLSSDVFPKTAQASPAVLENLFRDAHEAGDGAVYISISSGLSGTYQTAVMTREMLGHDECFVVDSLGGTGAQRMVVEYAVKLRDEGKSAAQIAEALESFRGKVTLYACINTLEYLYRGGRISHAVYKLGNLAQIKPIIHLDQEGKVVVPAKAMGMRKGMEMLCKRLETQKPDIEFPLYVMYTNNRSVAETLAQKLRTQGYEIPDARIISVGAAIGSHIGPDACGLVYIEKN